MSRARVRTSRYRPLGAGYSRRGRQPQCLTPCTGAGGRLSPSVAGWPEAARSSSTESEQRSPPRHASWSGQRSRSSTPRAKHGRSRSPGERYQRRCRCPSQSSPPFSPYTRPDPGQHVRGFQSRSPSPFGQPRRHSGHRFRSPTPPPPGQPGPSATATGQLHQFAGLLNSIYSELSSLKDQVAVKGDLIDHLRLVVPAELKDRICDGKFVDLADLLKKSFMHGDDQQKLCVVADQDGVLTFRSMRQSSRGALSIDQWTSAFHTYMSVYLARHPTEVQDMLAYMELIREAARDNPMSPAWREYDERFRTKKAADPARPWAMIDNQLWLLTVCRPPATDAKQPARQTARSDQVCFNYNKLSGCHKQTCSFKHVYSGCGEQEHGILSCQSQSKTALPSKDGKHKSKAAQAQPGQSFPGKK